MKLYDKDRSNVMNDVDMCFTCGNYPAAVTLDGYQPILCTSCWDSMSIYERLVVVKKYSPSNDEEWGDSVAVVLCDIKELLEELVNNSKIGVMKNYDL